MKYLLLLTYLTVIISKAVLMFGDSVDRQTVIEFCFKYMKNGMLIDKPVEWGSGSLTYASNRKGRMGTLICRIKDYSISFVHCFGSNATGPYNNYITTAANDPYVDTAIRMEHALEIYNKTYNSNNLTNIYIQFFYWDIGHIVRKYGYLQKNDTKWNSTLLHFYDNYIERINQLQNYIYKYNLTHIDIGLHTGVVPLNKGEHDENYLNDYNNIFYEIKQLYNNKITLYDYHRDMSDIIQYISLDPILSQWNHIQLHNYLFRDNIHPQPIISQYVADKLLTIRYSKYIQQNINFWNNFLINNSIYIISLIYYNKQLFGINKEMNTYFLINQTCNQYYLLSLYYGNGDIYPLTLKNQSESFFQLYKQTNELPCSYHDYTIILFSDNSSKIIFVYNFLLKEMNLDNYNYFYKSFQNKLNNTLIVNSNESWLTLLPKGKSILPIFSMNYYNIKYNNTNLLIREVNTKEVFVMKNGYRFPLTSKSFFQFAKDFEEVFELATEDMSFIPMR